MYQQALSLQMGMDTKQCEWQSSDQELQHYPLQNKNTGWGIYYTKDKYHPTLMALHSTRNLHLGF